MPRGARQGATGKSPEDGPELTGTRPEADRAHSRFGIRTHARGHVIDSDEKLARKASARYWESDESVNGIADAFGISKGRLYDLLRPLPVQGSCPECGSSPPAYLNRTARDREVVSCLMCGWEGARSDLDEAPPLEDREAAQPGPPLHRESELERDGPSLVGLGGLLVGIAIGIALGRMLDR